MMSFGTQGQEQLFQKLAVARRRYHSTETKTLPVRHERTREREREQDSAGPPMATAPQKKVFDCIFDYPALVNGFSDVKKWLTNGALSITIPTCVLDEFIDAKAAEDRKGAAASSFAADILAYLAKRSSIGPEKGAGGSISVQESSEKIVPWSRVESYLFPHDEEFASTNQPALGESDSVVQPRSLPSFDTVIEAETPPTSTHDGSKDVDLKLSVLSLKSDAALVGEAVSANGLTKDKLDTLPGRKSIPETSRNEFEKQLLERINYFLDDFPPSPQEMLPAFSYMTHELFNCVTYRTTHTKTSSSLSRVLVITDDPETRYWSSKLGIPVKGLDELARLIGLEYKDFKGRMALYQKQHFETNQPPETHINPTKRRSRDFDRPLPSASNQSQLGHRRQSRSFDAPLLHSPLQPPSPIRAAEAKTVPQDISVSLVANQPFPEVIDPNSFSRTNGANKGSLEEQPPRSNRYPTSRRARGGGRLWTPTR